MEQVSYGKQRGAKNGTAEIEIVTDAMFNPPMHPGKEVKCFANMCKDDHNQTSGADEL